jgi:hypothetical protein
LKKYKSQSKAVEVTLNSKDENSEGFCLDFVLEFGLKAVNMCRSGIPEDILSKLQDESTDMHILKSSYCLGD